MSTPPNGAPPTPTEESDPIPKSQPTVDFSPATVPYNTSFENDLMKLILYPPANPVRPTPSPTPPIIPASALPIPLNSPLRTHPSPIAGLYLTHRHGYHTGGPGPSPDVQRAYAERMGLSREELKVRLGEKVRELRGQMVDREDAIRRNGEVEEELATLRLQREAEVRVLKKVGGK